MMNEYKKMVENKAEKLKEWIRDRYDKNDYNGFFSSIKSFITFMYDKDNSSQLPLYFENMKRLDKVRNQNLFNVFPELINLKGHEIV